MKHTRGSIGFIGLGHMGAPMARNLLRAGYWVRVYDLDGGAMAALTEVGADAAAAPGDAVDPGGLICSMVPDDAALEQIVCGEQGILSRIGAGGVHVSFSTVSPAMTRRVAERYSEQGSALVTATVSGRPDVAAAAGLSILVAGPQAAKARVLSVLGALGKRIYDLGEQQAAAAGAKLALNHIISCIILALADSTALAQAAGVDPAAFLGVVRESPLFAGKAFEYAQMLAEDSYQPALFPVPLGQKDLHLMLAAAAEAGVALPTAERHSGLLQFALEQAWGNEDWAVAGRAILHQAGLWGAGRSLRKGAPREA